MWTGPAISLVVLQLALLRVVCDIGSWQPVLLITDVRAVHTASGAGVRVVGGCVALAADAGALAWVCADAILLVPDRQPPLRRHRCPGLPR